MAKIEPTARGFRVTSDVIGFHSHSRLSRSEAEKLKIKVEKLERVENYQKAINDKKIEVERSIENSKDGSLINRVIGQSEGLNMAIEIISNGIN